MKKNKETRYLRCDFSHDDIHNMGQDLARKYQERARVDSELDSVKAQFKQKTNAIELVIQELSTKVANGYEHKEVECKVTYHSPTVGSKTIIRLDTGEEVSTEAMTQGELQEWLPFPDVQSLSDRLEMAGLVVTPQEVDGFTAAEFKLADAWANHVIDRKGQDRDPAQDQPAPEFLKHFPLAPSLSGSQDSEQSPTGHAEAAEPTTDSTEAFLDTTTQGELEPVPAKRKRKAASSNPSGGEVAEG